MRAALRNLRNVIFGLSLVSAVLTAVCVILLCLGIRPFIVGSPSMEPFISEGDLALVKITHSPQDTQLGDVLVYRTEAGSYAMHRLVAPDTLRGDANNTEQHVELSGSNLIGREVAVLPNLGPIAQAICAHPYVFWTLPIAFFVLACLLWGWRVKGAPPAGVTGLAELRAGLTARRQTRK